MIKVFFEKSAGDSYKQMSEAVHSLLKRELARHLCLSVDDIVISKDDKGCPYIEGKDDIFVSLSHSYGVVMCAFSDTPVGVDIELVKKRHKSVERRVFTEGEISLVDSAEDEDKAFFTLWTLKESYLKAIGTGFSDNAKETEFFSLDLPIESNKPEYSFSVGECEGFVYSVCEKKFA